MGWTTGGQFPAGEGWDFLFPTASGLALGPTQPPIQRGPGAHNPEVKRSER